MSASKTSWTNLLKQYVQATKRSRELAIKCSLFALEHFMACGDVVYVQEFFDAMHADGNKNYVRGVAFGKWAVHHAPIKFTDGKFTKDQDRAKTMMPEKDKWLEKAKAEPFYDFAPSPEVMYYDASDPVQHAIKAVKKFENENKFKPKDKAASAKVAAVLNALQKVA